MSTLYRTTLAMCCLASLLPLGALAADAEQPPVTNEAPAAPAPRPPLLERSQEDAQALERLVPKAEQQTLQGGADSFLALWKPANDSDPQGAVIIVPGAGETADWPNAVGPLRRKFPDVGWHSLSISLPDLLADSPQARVEAKPAAKPAPEQGESAPAKDLPADANANVAQATAADADTAESTDAAQASEQTDPADAARIFARLDAAVAFAQQHNARSIVLIGHGSGAYWAARYLSEQQPPQVQKLVLVAAQTPGKPGSHLESAHCRHLLRHPQRRPQRGRAAPAGQQAAEGQPVPAVVADCRAGEQGSGTRAAVPPGAGVDESVGADLSAMQATRCMAPAVPVIAAEAAPMYGLAHTV